MVVELSGDQMYSATGVKSFGKGLIHYAPNIPDNLSKMRYYTLPPSSLIISNIKAWEGAVAVTGPSVPNEAVISNRFHCYRPRSYSLDLEFFARYLLSESGISQLGAASPGTADRNRTLSINGLESVRIPLPPLDEQRRIAAWLAEINLKSRRVSSVHQGASLLSEAVLQRMVDDAATSPLRRLGDLVNVSRPTVDIVLDATYEPVGVRSFGKGLIRYPSVLGSELGKLRYSKLPSASLVVSNIKAWEGALAMATATDGGRVSSNRFIPLLAKDPRSTHLDFIRIFLLSKAGLRALGDASPGSADRNRTTSVDRLLDINIPMPSIENQRMISRAATLLARPESKVRGVMGKLDALLPSALNQVFGSLT